MILAGAEPFFFPGGPHGVLLVHGFTGLPADMLPLGLHLQEMGFSVLGVRLAGHGTSPEDLARMTWGDWMDSVRDGYALLAGYARRVSVVGHSMGGLLALLLAAEAHICRVVTLAAPIFVAEERGIHLLPPREIARGKYVPKARRHLQDVPSAVNRTYRRMPIVSIHEMLGAIEAARHALPRVGNPLLVFHSHGDHTAAPASADYIYEHAASHEKELFWVANSGHLLPLDEERETVFERTARFLSDCREAKDGKFGQARQASFFSATPES